MYVTIFVLAMIAVIMFHEFGHFATAKAFGMKCEKFFLGFGPTLWSVHKGETEYGVKAIPAGGFVKITGMSRFEEIDPGDAGRTFHEQRAWKRAIVLSAGSFTHFIVAWALLFGALAFIGLGTAEGTNAVDVVSEDSPAAAAGLTEGDRIVAVDGQPTADFEAVRSAILPRGGQTVTLTVERDGARQEVSATIAAQTPTGEEAGFLGVGPEVIVHPPVPLGAGEALAETWNGDLSLWNLTRETMLGLGRALSPAGLSEWLGSVGDEGPRSPEGPISLVGVGQAVSALGQSGDLFAVLAILASLNIVLGVLNMLPLPPLDGGHLAVLATEETVNKARRIRGKEGRWSLDPAKLTPIALAVIMFFVVISLTALYVDIVKPASELFQ
jgi:membrane-associated protease RseP (regulator of RpoE activity)